MSDLFQGIETVVPGNTGGTPLTEGDYLLRIEDVIFLNTQMKGDAFIVEYTIVESSSPKEPVGAKRSWYQSMTNRPVAMGEIVKFMYAALGYEQKRDEARIATEVTPNIKAWTNAACKEKILNGKVNIRATVRRKAPSAKALAAAAAAGKSVPTGYENVRFSPASPNPPPVRS